MKIFVLFPMYIIWHYTTALADLRRIFDNLLWFIFNLFSIDILLSTLFSPWKRLSTDYTSSHPTFFSNFVVNTLMRVVGLLIRSVTIILGLIFFTVTSIGFVVAFLVWIVLPLLSVFLLIYGLGHFV